MTIDKRYLGDGVSVAFEGYALVLTTSNGTRITNTIVLEPEVYMALVRYVEALDQAPRAPVHDP